MYTPNRTARKCHDVLFVTSIVKTTELLRKKQAPTENGYYKAVKLLVGRFFCTHNKA
ncbi:unnamed protein product, partial [Tenebrio molitor]